MNRNEGGGGGESRESSTNRRNIYRIEDVIKMIKQYLYGYLRKNARRVTAPTTELGIVYLPCQLASNSGAFRNFADKELSRSMPIRDTCARIIYFCHSFPLPFGPRKPGKKEPKLQQSSKVSYRPDCALLTPISGSENIAVRYHLRKTALLSQYPP